MATLSNGANLTTVANVLKDMYLPPVVEQLNNEVLLLQRLESRDQELVGKQAIVPLHTGRSGGIGPAPEGGSLPTSGNQVYAKASYDLKYLYGRVQVTGPSMAKTASEQGAFLQTLKGELDGIRADLTKDLARQVYGDGSGTICLTAANTTQTTLTLGTGGTEALTKGQLYVGMKVDIGAAATPSSLAAGVTITAVNLATPSITISGSAITTLTSTVITRAGATAGTSATSYEVDGLKKLVSSAANTVGGIDATAAGNDYWDNQRSFNGGTPRALTTDMLMQAFNSVRRKGGTVGSIITSLGVQRAYFNLLQGQVRYTEPMTIKGGFSTLEFMNKPLIADIDAPWGQAYFLDEDKIKVFSPRDWHFLDEDGNVLKWVIGFDAWEAVLARYLNLGVSRRNTQYVLGDLTDTTGI